MFLRGWCVDAHSYCRSTHGELLHCQRKPAEAEEVLLRKKSVQQI